MNKSTSKAQEKPEAAAPSAPPGYSQAVAPVPSLSFGGVHTFVRNSRFGSKVFVRYNGVDRYCFAASKDGKVWVHAGASTDNPPLGFLAFPEIHNAFRMHFGDNQDLFSDAKARVGYPHPKTFTFKTPKGVGSSVKEYVWTHQGGDVPDNPPARYNLTVDTDSNPTTVATLTVSKKGKEGTSLRWRVEPESEVEQAFLVASSIGVLTRMSNKAKFHDKGMGTGMSRWFGFWWMASLTTIAIA